MALSCLGEGGKEFIFRYLGTAEAAMRGPPGPAMAGRLQQKICLLAGYPLQASFRKIPF